MMMRQIAALLPDFSAYLLQCDLVFHSSITERFPADFRVLQARSASDRCIIINFSSSDPNDARYLVVCLLSMSFSIIKSAAP